MGIIDDNFKVGIFSCSIDETPKCSIVSVTVEGNQHFALVDCGAVISLTKPGIAKGFITKSNMNLVDIQGNSIPTSGMSDVQLTFSGEIVVQHSFVVIETETFQADILLGIDFLRQHGVKIDWSNNCMYAFEREIPLLEENSGSKLEERVALLESQLKNIEKYGCALKNEPKKTPQLALPNVPSLPLIAQGCSDQMFNGHLDTEATEHQKQITKQFVTNNGNAAASIRGIDLLDLSTDKGNENMDNNHLGAPVTLLKDLVLPPMTQAICFANLRGLGKVSTPFVVLEPNDETPKGLLVARVLCKTGKNIPLRVTNITESDLVLKSKMTIALAYEVETRENNDEKNKGAVRRVTAKDVAEILQTLHLDNPKSAEENELKNLVMEYIDIFKSPDQKLSCTSNVMHRIITEDVPPILKRPYRVPFYRQEILKREIQKLLDDGIITESQSPWSFPAILVEKKRHPGEDIQYRLCIDYRDLNAITKTDYFPLPNIQETIDKLSGARLFSTMDLASGYFQVPVYPDDQEKTGFSTPDNHYHFLRMAMGLKNAPATWSRMMHHILGKLTYTACLVYLDDIIVFSQDEQTHLKRLRHVFQKMREANLKFKPTKCNFMKKETEYLGHLIIARGLTTHPDKTKIIESYPIPASVKELRAFLGLCGFYRKFVTNFAKISQPLTLLTKKDVKYSWGPEQQEAFVTLKRALISPPVLRYPDFSKQFIVNTDASATAVAAILTQKHDGVELPICFSSRTLNAAERRYSAIERECLAVVFAVKTYRNYLTGTHFVIMTDHRPLKYLLTMKDPSSRLSKWAMYLMEYSFTILYRPGKQNTNVDSLTRLGTEQNNPENIIAHIATDPNIKPMVNVIWSSEELKNLQHSDPELIKIITTLRQ